MNIFKKVMCRKKKAVIILGAGAVKAWDAPLTNELTDKIKIDRDFLTLSGIPLGQYVCDKLVEFYRGSSYGINFETIINTLESIIGYYMNNTVLGGNPSFVSSFPKWFDTNGLVAEMMNFEFISGTFVDGRGTIRNNSNHADYGNYPRERAEVAYLGAALKHYLSIIREGIARYCRDLNSQDFKSLNSELKNFLNGIIKSGYDVRVYTTNYDRLLPELFKEDKSFDFFDGFDIPNGKNIIEEKFLANISRILNDTSCLNYYCLHGCIYWDYNSNNNDIKYQFECTPDTYHTMTLYNITESTNPGEDTFVYNIVTGYNKLQRVSIEPLNSFHSIFAKDCINANLIITAGYSFSDFHINRPIRNAIRFNDSKLLHISFGGEDYPAAREFRFMRNNILEMKDDFRGTETTDGKWIKSKSGKQMVFHKGFKDFIENKEWMKGNI